MESQKVGKPLPITLLELKPLTPGELNIVGDFQRTVSMLLGYTGSALVPVKVDSGGVLSVGSVNIEAGLATLHTDLDTTLSTTLTQVKDALVQTNIRLADIVTATEDTYTLLVAMYDAGNAALRVHETP